MLMRIAVLFVLSALPYVESAVATSNPILAHVIFRHGDRTNDINMIYPKDPYRNFTYFPLGLGELTNKGKLRMYNVGRALRRRYHDFLGEVLTSDTVIVRTTEFNRAKTSAELVLAGAFPPKKHQIWKGDVPWQPIPYTYVPMAEDKLLLGVLHSAHRKVLDAYFHSPGPQSTFRNYSHVFEDLSELTGFNVNTTLIAHFIYHCLTSEKDYGLELPGWTKRYYPKILEQLAVMNFLYLSGTLELKRLNTGALLKKIVDDSKAKIVGLLPSERKLYLYSGHDVNVALFLTTLGLYDNQQPYYGSQVIVEVHKIDGVYGIKLFHDANHGKGPRLLTLDGCDCFCPIDQFVSLVQNYFPVSDSQKSVPLEH